MSHSAMESGWERWVEDTQQWHLGSTFYLKPGWKPSKTQAMGRPTPQQVHPHYFEFTKLPQTWHWARGEEVNVHVSDYECTAWLGWRFQPSVTCPLPASLQVDLPCLLSEGHRRTPRGKFRLQHFKSWKKPISELSSAAHTPVLTRGFWGQRIPHHGATSRPSCAGTGTSASSWSVLFLNTEIIPARSSCKVWNRGGASRFCGETKWIS